MLRVVGVATIIYGIIAFFQVGKYKVATKEMTTFLIILCIPFLNASNNGTYRIGQIIIAMVIFLVLFIVVPFLLNGFTLDVYMSLSDIYQMFEGLDLFKNSEVLVMRNGVRLYVLEDGSKVKASGKGRLKVSIRNGFDFNRIKEIRSIILTEVVKYDTRVHSYIEVVIIFVFAAICLILSFI